MKPSATVFLDALEKGETVNFLAGAAPYFIDAKNDNEEPQNVNDAFNLAVFAAWQESRDPRIPESFSSGLRDLLKTYPDCNRAIYLACDWLWIYTRCLADKRKNPDSAYKDIFEVDFNEVTSILQKLLESNEVSLKLDQRWAGAEWNSAEGLWTPLLRQAISIRDQLGGPDFVPHT